MLTLETGTLDTGTLDTVTLETGTLETGTLETVTLETETLELFPRRSYASTDDKVIIRQTGVYIEAVGLNADLNENRITLRQNVTSIYEPEES